jgi:hypothetical protein
LAGVIERSNAYEPNKLADAPIEVQIIAPDSYLECSGTVKFVDSHHSVMAPPLLQHRREEAELGPLQSTRSPRRPIRSVVGTSCSGSDEQ